MVLTENAKQAGHKEGQLHAPLRQTSHPHLDVLQCASQPRIQDSVRDQSLQAPLDVHQHLRARAALQSLGQLPLQPGRPTIGSLEQSTWLLKGGLQLLRTRGLQAAQRCACLGHLAANPLRLPLKLHPAHQDALARPRWATHQDRRMGTGGSAQLACEPLEAALPRSESQVDAVMLQMPGAEGRQAQGQGPSLE